MKAYIIRYLVLLTLFCLNVPCHAQEAYYERPYPVVGDTIADYTFTDIVNYAENKVSISDFRGKWLILDYWAETCSGCLYSFPKMNALHERFKGQVQIIMIGAHLGKLKRKELFNSESRTKGIYEVLNKMYSLSLLVAFDSVLHKRHDVGSLPHLLVIDPNGVLRTKTTSVDSVQIENLIAGKPVDFKVALTRTEVDEMQASYNNDLPVLTTGGLANGGIDTNFHFRSILAPFDKRQMTYRTLIDLEKEILKNRTDRSTENFRIELRGALIHRLYLAAFFGNNFWEVNDPMYQKYSDKIKWNLPDNDAVLRSDKQLYTYSLTVPKSKADKEYVLTCMQADLERFFGYKAEVKKVRMPVMYLKVRDKRLVEKLRNTTGITSYANSDVVWQGSSATNKTMKSFMLQVAAWTDAMYKLPVYDKTKIDYNLDITLEGNQLEREYGIRELDRLGFKLVKGRKKLARIVISK